MVREPERHFDLVWKISMGNVALLTALFVASLFLEIPRTYITHLALWALSWFGSAELAAGGVQSGKSGTKTSWLFWNVRSDLLRVLIGFWMGILMFFVFPQHWIFLVIATGFFLWLPIHYTEPGAEGPVDWFVQWVRGLFR